MAEVKPTRGNTTVLRPGDELVLLRRRFDMKRDEETLEETVISSDQEISVVRCPEDVEIYGGDMFSEFDENNKFIVIRLKCRNTLP